MTRPATAGEVRFSFAEMREEIAFVTATALSFFEDSAAGVLGNYQTTLDNIRYSKGSGVLEITQAEPLVTKPSHGEYDKGPGLPVFAEITSLWHLACVREEKKSIAPRCFQAFDIASTVVVFRRGSHSAPGEPIATWKMEFGAPGAPGCYFHSHIVNGVGLPVPRLPILPASPMTVVEFVLGELFQKEWRELSSYETHEQTRWRILQSERLRRFSDWQKSTVADITGSPWVALKNALPPADIFLHQ